MKTRRLVPRVLGRTQRLVPPVIWEIDSRESCGREVLERCAQAQANWFFAPAGVGEEALRAFVERHPSSQCGPAEAYSLVLGVEPDHLLGREMREVVKRLEAVGRRECDAVMLQSASPAELKSGRAFHQLSKMRDGGMTQSVFLFTESVSDAEWLVENTPAHGVALPYGLLDQTAMFRVLEAADEMGTAVMSCRPREAVWEPEGLHSTETDLSFRVAAPGVTSVVEPLPGTVEELDRMLEAVSRPMAVSERSRWWEQFQQRVSPPPKPRLGHPPEGEM